MRMFSFFHRTPKINVDCFISDPVIYKHTPIVRASKTIPEWWKKIKPSQVKFNWEEEQKPRGSEINMRNCQGFLDLYKKGAVVENWTDIQIKSTQENLAYYISYGMPPTPHPKSQIGDGFKHFHHLKFNSPWLLRERTNVDFLYIQAAWAHEDYSFRIMPGVLNFTNNRDTNVNTFFPAIDDEFIIPVGLPMTHIVPLTDKNVTFTNHLVDDTEYRMLKDYAAVSFKGWRSSLDLFKRNNERQGKCPFGFGD